MINVFIINDLFPVICLILFLISCDLLEYFITINEYINNNANDNNFM